MAMRVAARAARALPPAGRAPRPHPRGGQVSPGPVSVAVRLRSSSSASAASPPPSEELRGAKPFAEVPGPRPLPGLGNLWRFVPGIGDLADVPVHRLPGELVRRYGPLVKLEGMMTKTRVFVADPDAVQQVFRTEGPWPIREGISSIDYYYRNHRRDLGVSLGTANGETWQKFRTAVNQVVMQPRNVKVYVEPIDDVTVQFIERMKTIRDQGDQQLPDDFKSELKKWAGESITYVALDTRLGLLEAGPAAEAEAARLISLVENAFDAMAELEFGLSPWRLVSTPTWRRFCRSMDTFTEMAMKRVDEVVLRLAQLSPAELAERQLSVLERLLVNNSNDPHKGVAFALDMMLAGIDTTANQAAFLLYQLASNPARQRALQAELDREWPAGEPLSAAVLERLKYLRAVVKETMRLQGTVSGIQRTVSRDLNLMGYLIPKGTETILCTGVMSLDERLVPRAAEFVPERWLAGPAGGEEALRPGHPFVSLPFGFGPRMCAGRRFADLEMEVLLARLFRSHSLEWHHPTPQVEQKLFVTFTSPLRITMRDR